MESGKRRAAALGAKMIGWWISRQAWRRGLWPVEWADTAAVVNPLISLIDRAFAADMAECDRKYRRRLRRQTDDLYHDEKKREAEDLGPPCGDRHVIGGVTLLDYNSMIMEVLESSGFVIPVDRRHVCLVCSALESEAFQRFRERTH